MDHALSLAVAPMMDRTDRHFRYLMRLVSPNARLYTEMITTAAVLHGDRARLLEFDELEHPVVIQLGGNDPAALAETARIAAAAGFDEVNLNVGCPSGRVQAGNFGVRLMLEPGLVADCVAAMRAACDIPVTVKTRIGVDEQDDYGILYDLTERLIGAGVSGLVVHARKAWLEGLSPKRNREVPPLDYPRVYRLKDDFPELTVVINGGFTRVEEVLAQSGRVDGVMLGRAAYHEPMLIGELDRRMFATQTRNDELEVVSRFAEYVRTEVGRGTPLTAMTRHLVGLFKHRPGARRWRRLLSNPALSVNGIDDLIGEVARLGPPSRYNAEFVGDPTQIYARGMRA